MVHVRALEAAASLVAGWVLLGAAFGAKPPAATRPATAPATQRVVDAARIEQLIGQLGHTTYAVRDAAAVELRKLGSAALAQLAQATRSSDPELSARAQYVLEEIREQLKSAPVAAGEIRIEDLVGRWTGNTQFQNMGVALIVGADGVVAGGDMGGHPLQKKGKASIADGKVTMEFYFADVCQTSKKTIEKVTFTRAANGAHRIEAALSNPCFPPSNGWIRLTRQASATQPTQ